MSLALLHSPGNVIRWLIINLGLGSDPQLNPQQAWPTFWNSEADIPDSVVTVYDTSGILDGRSMIDGEIYEHFGFQVRVRAPKARDSFPQLSAIVHTFAEGVLFATVGISDSSGNAEYIVSAINRKTPLIDMKKESPTSERSVFTCNFTSAIYRKT